MKTHWPDVPKWQDIKTLTKEDFIEKTNRRSIDLITGGFPCQPFSTAGKRRGFADDRYLWPEMLRVIRELRPAWVLGENVAGFVDMGLDKTLSDLESEGYEARAFVLPACAVQAWHERARTLIVGVDVSHAACQRHGKKCEYIECLPLPERSIPQSESKRNKMVASPLCGGVLPDADSLGRIPLDIEAGKSLERQAELKSCGANSAHGAAREYEDGAQPRLGGMADGIPQEMDGHFLWRKEPENIPRMTDRTDNRANRLKTLGNAVVPQQIYPILKAIADIETGRCREGCFFDGLNDEQRRTT